MINAKEALDIILNHVRPLGTCTLSLEQALGLVLAEEIISAEYIPAFDNSAMDGFAVRSEEVSNVPATLRIVNEIPAGAVSEKHLLPGEAMPIMTGAKIPEGCNAVVQLEWTERVDEHLVNVMRRVEPGQNIRRVGADVQKGSLVFSPGTELRPQELGVLASLGKQFVSVYRPPRVAVLVTGNEIVEINRPVPDGKIRNSNGYVLSALLRQVGCTVLNLGIVKDSREELHQKLSQGLSADVLITSGGVSAGTYDLVPEVLQALGVERKVWKVNIKPGMPMLFGMSGAVPVFGLPGNPVSTYVTFLQFVKPAILAMKGARSVLPFRFRAALKESIIKKDKKRHFLRGILEEKEGVLHVHSTGSQVSNILTSLSKANCFIILPEESATVEAGDTVEVELI
ncbi:MAG: molybdopterin molybdenumtransferase MoeA [Bacteroidetes bacterium]|nr:MAG: molybdopterin molybdenumtransferase MoeA [Bacteroidota bacterium]